MKGNDLLFWLSHLGEGTWDTYRNAVFELCDESEQTGEAYADLVHRTRYRLSDIGAVDFFPEKRRRWSVLEPLLASLAENSERAVLCGGRSPALVATLHESSTKNRCVLENTPRQGLPDHIVVVGEATLIQELSGACGIARSTSFEEEMIRQFVPIETHLDCAPKAELMIGWKRRFFDLETLEWTEQPIIRTACECISQYGRRMSFLQVSRKRTILLPRREAIYAAAALARKSIVNYDAASRELRVPMHAPLPEPCARLVCISSGSIGELDRGTVRYRPVSARVAHLISVSLGQGQFSAADERILSFPDRSSPEPIHMNDS